MGVAVVPLTRPKKRGTVDIAGCRSGALFEDGVFVQGKFGVLDLESCVVCVQHGDCDNDVHHHEEYTNKQKEQHTNLEVSFGFSPWGKLFLVKKLSEEPLPHDASISVQEVWRFGGCKKC